jgi:hypothetical protein
MPIFGHIRVYAASRISSAPNRSCISLRNWISSFPAHEIGPYVLSQLIGAIVAAAILYVIASGGHDFDLAKGFAANGYGEHSPAHYGLFSCLLAEVVLNRDVPFHHYGLDAWKAGRFCTYCDRARAHADPPNQHSYYEHVCESGSQHGCLVRGRMGAGTALAVLGGSAGGWCDRRNRVSSAQRATFGRGHRHQASPIKDYQRHLETLRKQASEAALVRDLTTVPHKRELFTKLAEDLQILADEVERAMNAANDEASKQN